MYVVVGARIRRTLASHLASRFYDAQTERTRQQRPKAEKVVEGFQVIVVSGECARLCMVREEPAVCAIYTGHSTTEGGNGREFVEGKGGRVVDARCSKEQTSHSVSYARYVKRCKPGSK